MIGVYDAAMNISNTNDAKRALQAAVERKGVTRSSFARQSEGAGGPCAHTTRCILSDASVIGQRKPSLDSFLTLAHAAGMSVHAVFDTDVQDGCIGVQVRTDGQ